MRWFSVLLALLIVHAPATPASAQVKSILRFEKGAGPPESEKAGAETDAEGASGREGEVRQGTAGSTRQGTLVGEGETGAGENEASGTPGLPEALALPGQPAALTPPGTRPPAAIEPPLTEAPALVPPAVPGRAPVRPEAAGKAGRSGAAEGIAPRPETPKPFTYERAPVAQGTWSGYDAAVAPGPGLADPVAPPGLGTAQPGAVQRPLPRLAPYGYALPPGESTPPVARPR